MNQVQQELRKKVEGKRYLLVLDDIWNEDREHWLQLMTLLVDGAKGIKVIVTTRSEKVAKITGTSSLFFLKGLDEKQYWRLFSQLAFENGKEPDNQNLLSIGKEIVKKCAEVPLAIRSIGSLMYSMHTERDWSSFKNKDLIKIDEQGGNKFFQLIKRSYDHLSFHLKKCFAFWSLFPKDYYIMKTKLIQLWIGQGFVQSSDGSTSLEDIGEKYFMTLVHRSFFQDLIDDYASDIVSFQMHDLVIDLARFISGNNYVIVNEKGQHIDIRTHHVFFGFSLDFSWQVPSFYSRLTNYGHFYYHSKDTTSKHSAEASELRELNNLRKGLKIIGLERLRRSPTEAKDINLMGNSHLQRLTLLWDRQINGDANDKEHDDIILQGLLLHSNTMALKIRGFDGVTFSSSINSFTNLKELKLSGCTRLQYIPQFLVKKPTLKKLSCLRWIVNDSSNGSSSSFSPSLTEIFLNSLPSLKGWCRCSEEEMARGCFHQFNNLDILNIHHCPNLVSIPQHINISTVELWNVREKILQQAVIHSKVEFLHIQFLDDLKSIFGVLQHLTMVCELYIKDCKELDLCNDEGGYYGMQWKELNNLKLLHFDNIPNMESLPEGLRHVTTLQSLRIANCGISFIPEWLTSIQVLTILDCYDLRSEFVPEGLEVDHGLGYWLGLGWM